MSSDLNIIRASKQSYPPKQRIYLRLPRSCLESAPKSMSPGKPPNTKVTPNRPREPLSANNRFWRETAPIAENGGALLTVRGAAVWKQNTRTAHVVAMTVFVRSVRRRRLKEAEKWRPRFIGWRRRRRRTTTRIRAHVRRSGADGAFSFWRSRGRRPAQKSVSWKGASSNADAFC